MPQSKANAAVCRQCGAAHPQEFPAKVGDVVQLSDGKKALVTCTLPAHFTAIRYKRDPKTGRILRDKNGKTQQYTADYKNPLPWAMVCYSTQAVEAPRLIADTAYFASFPVDSSQVQP